MRKTLVTHFVSLIHFIFSLLHFPSELFQFRTEGRSPFSTLLRSLNVIKQCMSYSRSRITCYPIASVAKKINKQIVERNNSGNLFFYSFVGCLSNVLEMWNDFRSKDCWWWSNLPSLRTDNYSSSSEIQIVVSHKLEMRKKLNDKNFVLVPYAMILNDSSSCDTLSSMMIDACTLVCRIIKRGEPSGETNERHFRYHQIVQRWILWNETLNHIACLHSYPYHGFASRQIIS